MKIIPQKIKDVYLLEMDPFKDARGSFARQFCQHEMAKVGLDIQIKQCNLSRNTYKGTLRGLHYQKAPFPEAKIVSCLQGIIFDVVVDLRPDSFTYLQYLSTELSAQNQRMIYIPPYCAHGFQSLQDDTVVYYQCGEFFHPEAYDGVRYNDPKLNITWPLENPIMNERDRNYVLL